MLNLNTLHGEVLRLTGIVDRMGQRPAKDDQANLTVCVKSLCLASTGESIHPNHCWLPLREELAHLHLQPGDKIGFTTKIHRIKKGYQPSDHTRKKTKGKGKRQSPLRTAYGPGHEIKNVFVINRARRLDQSPEVIEERFTSQLDIERQEKEHLFQVVENLNSELQSLNQLKHERPKLEQTIAQKDTEIQTLKHERPKLEQTIAQLQDRVRTSLPRQQALSGVFLTALICLLTGYGVGAGASQASR